METPKKPTDGEVLAYNRKLVKAAKEIRALCKRQYPKCADCPFSDGAFLCGLLTDLDSYETPKDWRFKSDWRKDEKGFAKYLMGAFNENCIVRMTDTRDAFHLVNAMGKHLWSFPIGLFPSLEKNGGEALLSDIASEDT